MMKSMMSDIKAVSIKNWEFVFKFGISWSFDSSLILSNTLQYIQIINTYFNQKININFDFAVILTAMLAQIHFKKFKGTELSTKLLYFN